MTPQRVLRSLSRRLMGMAERLDARPTGMHYSKYRDCLLTIRALRELHSPVHVCDVGAHMGHWSLILSRLCPSVRHLVLLEPQPALQSSLARLPIPAHVQTVVLPIAVDEGAGKKVLHGSTASASLLAPEEVQQRLFPGSIDQASSLVETDTLDSVYGKAGLPWPDLVKVDVQGKELAVLKGATGVLSHASMLVIELSFRRLYQDQPACWQVLKFLDEYGYTFVASGYAWKAASNPLEIVQVDGIFKRSDLVTGV